MTSKRVSSLTSLEAVDEAGSGAAPLPLSPLRAERPSGKTPLPSSASPSTASAGVKMPSRRRSEASEASAAPCIASGVKVPRTIFSPFSTGGGHFAPLRTALAADGCEPRVGRPARSAPRDSRACFLRLAGVDELTEKVPAKARASSMAPGSGVPKSFCTGRSPSSSSSSSSSSGSGASSSSSSSGSGTSSSSSSSGSSISSSSSASDASA